MITCESLKRINRITMYQTCSSVSVGSRIAAGGAASRHAEEQPAQQPRAEAVNTTAADDNDNSDDEAKPENVSEAEAEEDSETEPSVSRKRAASADPDVELLGYEEEDAELAAAEGDEPAAVSRRRVSSRRSGHLI